MGAHAISGEQPSEDQGPGGDRFPRGVHQHETTDVGGERFRQTRTGTPSRAESNLREVHQLDPRCSKREVVDRREGDQSGDSKKREGADVGAGT